MSNRKNVVPEIFIRAAGLYEDLQAKLCHAYVTCPSGMQIQVAALIEKEFISNAKKEICNVVKRHGDCLLHRDDDDSGCAFLEDEELEWNIDPDDIEEYSVIIKVDNGSIFIMYDAPVYYANFGDYLVDESKAMVNAIVKAAEKYEDVQYYIYEGYYTIDTQCDGVVEDQFYSSIDCIPQKDTYIGKFFHDLWKNDEFWRAFEENIESYIDDYGEEDTQNEILKFLDLYGNDIGEDAKDVLCEHLEETGLEI